VYMFIFGLWALKKLIFYNTFSKNNFKPAAC
jgi:hypothetical protein